MTIISDAIVVYNSWVFVVKFLGTVKAIHIARDMYSWSHFVVTKVQRAMSFLHRIVG